MPLVDFRVPGEDAFRWVLLHGRTHTDGEIRVEFACRCTALSEKGLCTIYEDRPTVCREMIRGGAECLDYVRARRTPADYARIREAGDPQTIHKGDQHGNT